MLPNGHFTFVIISLVFSVFKPLVNYDLLHCRSVQSQLLFWRPVLNAWHVSKNAVFLDTGILNYQFVYCLFKKKILWSDKSFEYWIFTYVVDTNFKTSDSLANQYQ